MARSRLGCWMPPQKDGKNWAINIRVVLNGEAREITKKFRVRANAVVRKWETARVLSADARVSEFCISAPYKINRE